MYNALACKLMQSPIGFLHLSPMDQYNVFERNPLSLAKQHFQRVSSNATLQVKCIGSLILLAEVKQFIGLAHRQQQYAAYYKQIKHPNPTLTLLTLLNIFYRGCIIIIDDTPIMVIVNYQNFLREKIEQEAQACHDLLLKQSLASKEFKQLVMRLYQYCEELNIIKRRIEKLKFYSQRKQFQVVMPKLIDSQIKRIDTKAKEISTAYSLFLFKQKRFKVLSDESKYYEQLLAVILKISVDRCFNKEDSQHLTKEVNRLFRTNTFNTGICRRSFISSEKQRKPSTKLNETSMNYRVFRRSVYSQSSQIKPYVNNKTCFKSLKSRSPIISLWHPNSQFLSFSLANKKETVKKAVQL